MKMIYSRIHYIRKCYRGDLRFLSSNQASSNSVGKDGGFTITRKQRKALRLVNQEDDEPNEEWSEEDQVRKEIQLDEVFQEMKLGEELQELERQQEKPQPWLNLLGYPSRALWRSSPNPPPSYITESQRSILKETERTTKQLKRTREMIATNHKMLSLTREKERRRLVGKKQFAETSLMAKKERAQDRAAKLVLYNPEQTSVSLKYRFVPNYSITKRILAETLGLLGRENFQPKKVLDVGMGTGSASAAVLDYFHEDQKDKEINRIEWIHGIEPSQSMRDASNIIFDSVMEGQKFRRGRKTTRLTLGETIVPHSSASPNRDVKTAGSFDLAVCAYTLCELPTARSVLAMGAIIWEKLAPGGVAIFIEPGTPDGFNSLRSIRNMLLDCCPPEGDEMLDGNEECHVVAPCTHNGACPMVRHQRNFKRKGKFEEDDAEDGEFDEFLAMDDDDHDEDEDGDDFDPDDLDEIDLDESDTNDDKSKHEDRVIAAEKTDIFDTAFCSFVHGMPGRGRKQGEKFSYLVVQKRITGSSSYEDSELMTNPFQSSDVVNVLKQSLDAGTRSKKSNKAKVQVKSEEDLMTHLEKAVAIEDQFLDSNKDPLGLELVRGHNRNSWGRIVRAPIKRKKHVLLDYCASTRGEDGEILGRIVRSKITKRRSAVAAPGMYMSSRKARWGGLWPDMIENSESLK